MDYLDKYDRLIEILTEEIYTNRYSFGDVSEPCNLPPSENCKKKILNFQTPTDDFFYQHNY